jgi:FkbM family methyltransferase
MRAGMMAVPNALVDIGGESFTIFSDDDYLSMIVNGFEPDTVKLFRTLATGSDVVLDVEANIGCTALLFGELAKKVYAFEPSPTTFAFLEKNITHAALANVFPQNIGLGEESGEFPLTNWPSNRTGAFISTQTQASAGHVVEKVVIRKMDEFVKSMNLTNIDFIKIDVEGFEGHVLRGATEMLQQNKPVVALELNHWCLNAFQRTSIPDFFDLLRSIFPILFAIDGSAYLNLHDESYSYSYSYSYSVMYHHIIHNRFRDIVAAFDESQISSFRSLYEHKFVA